MAWPKDNFWVYVLPNLQGKWAVFLTKLSNLPDTFLGFVLLVGFFWFCFLLVSWVFCFLGFFLVNTVLVVTVYMSYTLLIFLIPHVAIERLHWCIFLLSPTVPWGVLLKRKHSPDIVLILFHSYQHQLANSQDLVIVRRGRSNLKACNLNQEFSILLTTFKAALLFSVRAEPKNKCT